MQNQRENLINIIARCNSKQIKQQWIQELSLATNIECAENQCDSCLIAQDCIEVTSQFNSCLSDCKVSPEERCLGCNFVGCVYID